VSTPANPSRRREPRYDLHLPVSVSLGGGAPLELTAVSENISAHGILLWAEAAIPAGTDIKLVVVVRSVVPPRNTYLTAAGKVLRLEKRDSSSFGVAVCCDEHPFQMTHSDSPRF
jgi:hypothetical protein